MAGGTYTYNPQSSGKPGTQPNSSGSKFRIYTVFNSKIQLDEISFPQMTKGETQKLEDVASVEYPLIRINDYILGRNEIESMTIESIEFLPRIILSCTFFNDVFVSREMPKDGDLISVAIRNKSDVLNIIRNDYVITGVVTNPKPTTVNAPTRMTFFGELFIPGLKSQKLDLSFLGTSMDALKNFCIKLGLGFASNEDNTDDKQIWLKANTSGDIFIKDTIQRSWKDEQSFYDAWIDIYYNLNFININKQLMSAEDKIDMAAMINNLDNNQTYGVDTTQGETQAMPKVFSNYMNHRTTSFYINSWKPNNRSSTITFQVGTKMTCEMFEHNINSYVNSDAQKYWALQIDPIYDKQKTNKYIILRGRATYDSSTNNKDLARANYSYVDLYEKFPWLGIQYTISNPNDSNLKWDGNQHKNYLRARVQNLINNKELEKLNLEISVNGTNFNIIRADKIPIVLVKKDAMENLQINQDAEMNDMLDMFYSGWY
ncbi:MAG: hypothetical protein WC554_14840, partial [Clostridia bacterium]